MEKHIQKKPVAEVQFGVRLPVKVVNDLKKRAIKEDRKIKDIVLEVFEGYLRGI